MIQVRHVAETEVTHNLSTRAIREQRIRNKAPVRQKQNPRSDQSVSRGRAFEFGKMGIKNETWWLTPAPDERGIQRWFLPMKRAVAAMRKFMGTTVCLNRLSAGNPRGAEGGNSLVEFLDICTIHYQDISLEHNSTMCPQDYYEVRRTHVSEEQC